MTWITRFQAIRNEYENDEALQNLELKNTFVRSTEKKLKLLKRSITPEVIHSFVNSERFHRHLRRINATYPLHRESEDLFALIAFYCCLHQ